MKANTTIKEILTDYDEQIKRYEDEITELMASIKYHNEHSFKEEKRICQLKLDAMITYYEVKAKYLKIDHEGREKKVTENFLVDAVSVTEAESRLTEKLKEVVRGESWITKASQSNISEVFASEEGDYWFKAKIAMVTIDEELGKEKKVNIYYLVMADNLKQAVNRIEENLAFMIVPYQIVGINLSNIVDVFPYENN